MAKFSKIQVLQKAAEQGMMPLFYHADIELGKRVIEACYKGGARLLEFTNRGDFAHEVFGELNKFCRYLVTKLSGWSGCRVGRVSIGKRRLRAARSRRLTGYESE